MPLPLARFHVRVLLRPSLGLCALLAACETSSSTPVPAADPPALVAELAAELSGTGPLVFWQALPPGYRSALSSRLARLQQNLQRADKGTWAAGCTLLREAALLAKLHGSRLSSRYPQLQMLAGPGFDLAIRRGADAGLRLSQSRLGKLETAALGQTEARLREFGQETWPLLLQALQGFRQLTPAQLADLRCSKVEGAELFRTQTAWGNHEGSWQQVEGHWLPSAFTRHWPELLAALDAVLAKTEAEDFPKRWRAMKRQCEFLSTQLRALRKSEDPLADLDRLAKLGRMLWRSLQPDRSK